MINCNCNHCCNISFQRCKAIYSRQISRSFRTSGRHPACNCGFSHMQLKYSPHVHLIKILWKDYLLDFFGRRREGTVGFDNIIIKEYIIATRANVSMFLLQKYYSSINTKRQYVLVAHIESATAASRSSLKVINPSTQQLLGHHHHHNHNHHNRHSHHHHTIIIIIIISQHKI